MANLRICSVFSAFLITLLLVTLKSTEAYNYHYMQEICDSEGVHVNLTQEVHTYGQVQLVRNGGYDPNLDCVMYIWAPAGHHLTIRFRKIDIYKPQSDCTDVLYLSGNTTTHTYCGYGTPSYALISTGQFIKLQFISTDHSGMDGPNDRLGFELYYTSFHDGECDTSGAEFQCRKDDRCIPRELTCDGRDNCGDWSDERSKVCGMPAGSIVMVTLICLLVGGTCCAACVYYAVDTKKANNRSSRSSASTSTRRRGSPRSNHVDPAFTIDYSTGSNPVMTSPMEPPPYSQLPPDYNLTGSENKGPLPPSYDNLTYENEDAPNSGNTSSGTQENPQTTSSGNAAQETENTNGGIPNSNP